MDSLPHVAQAVFDQSEPVLCPLCDYDLRGQLEPRCPECGYAFDWEELRDPARRLHPYLFEHHSERNAWSLRKTFFGSLFPRKFWAGLYPTQRSNFLRLIIYWLIISFLFVLPFAGHLGYTAIQVDAQNHLSRARVPTFMGPAEKQRMIKMFGSLQNWMDLAFPVLPNPRVFTAMLQTNWLRSLRLVPLFIIVWPWMTLASLMVFQASMRKARVKPVHVLRCVIYSAGGMICGSLALIGWLIWITSPATGLPRYYYSPGFTAIALPLLLVMLTYRLWIAYRKYLRFDHAMATVIASQVMVGLLVWKIGLDWSMLQW